MNEHATLITCLTPHGTGAIAVVAVRGPQAWAITHELFRPSAAKRDDARLPEPPQPGRFWLGMLGRDQVVLWLRTMTPTPWVEIHCHGGVEVIRLLHDLYRERGACVVSWQEFTAQLESARHAALADMLARTLTVRTAAIVLDQWHGAFARRLDEAKQTAARGDAATVRALLDRLKALVPVGRHLTTPWKVVIAGAPNVGKSSLTNALAGFTRCLVSSTPGTTRDVVTTTIVLDGWPIELSDTAGLRSTAERLERSGIERARRTLLEADLCIWMLDGAAAPELPNEARPWLYVINKCDLPAAWDRLSVPGAVQVSALTKTGLDALADAIVHRLVPTPPEAGEAVPLLEEDFELLKTFGPVS